MPLRYDCYTNHDLFEGLSDWLGLIFGASASPRPFNTKKRWLCHSLSLLLFMAVSIIPNSMLYYCMRHSFVPDET